ncbi:hypothetical protein [Comamonas sp. 26]|nr:hypothetical protein [Comamonas sp. 26]
MAWTLLYLAHEDKEEFNAQKSLPGADAWVHSTGLLCVAAWQCVGA